MIDIDSILPYKQDSGGMCVEIDTIHKTIIISPKLSEDIFDHSQNSMTRLFLRISVFVFTYVFINSSLYIRFMYKQQSVLNFKCSIGKQNHCSEEIT